MNATPFLLWKNHLKTKEREQGVLIVMDPNPNPPQSNIEQFRGALVDLGSQVTSQLPLRNSVQSCWDNMAYQVLPELMYSVPTQVRNKSGT